MSQEFSAVEAFAKLSPQALEALSGAAETQRIKGGDVLVRYGEEADALYLVRAGRFNVQLPDGRIVAEVEAGEPVGELAFFSGGTRTADVRATRDSEVYSLAREDYDRVAKKHPELITISCPPWPNVWRPQPARQNRWRPSRGACSRCCPVARRNCPMALPKS